MSVSQPPELLIRSISASWSPEHLIFRRSQLSSASSSYHVNSPASRAPHFPKISAPLLLIWSSQLPGLQSTSSSEHLTFLASRAPLILPAPHLPTMSASQPPEHLIFRASELSSTSSSYHLSSLASRAPHHPNTSASRPPDLLIRSTSASPDPKQGSIRSHTHSLLNYGTPNRNCSWTRCKHLYAHTHTHGGTGMCAYV